MLRDVLSVQVLLKSYGKQRGFDVKDAFSHVIFYYENVQSRNRSPWSVRSLMNILDVRYRSWSRR